MRKTTIILLIVILASCKARIQTVEKFIEVKTTDTIVQIKERIIVPPMEERFIITELCDSIKQLPIQFRKVFVVDGDSITLLTNEKNELQLHINRLERTLKKSDSLVRVKQKESTTTEKTTKVKTRYPWKLLLGLVGTIILFIIFPGIPKKLRLLIGGVF